MRSSASIPFHAGVLACLLVAAGLSAAAAPSFDDLGTAAAPTRDQAARTPDLAALDARLAEGEAATGRAFAALKKLWLAADKEEGGYWRAYEVETYEALRAHAEVVRQEAQAAASALAFVQQVVVTTLNSPPVSPQAHAALLERKPRMARVFGFYNTVLGYARLKQLRFDTAAPIPFNERRASIAQGVGYVLMPDIPFSLAGPADAISYRAYERPLSLARVRELVSELEGVVADARKIQATLKTRCAKETPDALLSYDGLGAALDVLEFDGTLEDFQRSIKPLVGDFIEAMVRGIGARHELQVTLGATDRELQDLDLRVAVDRARASFVGLHFWGVQSLVSYDGPRHLRRNFLLVPR